MFFGSLAAASYAAGAEVRVFGGELLSDIGVVLEQLERQPARVGGLRTLPPHSRAW